MTFLWDCTKVLNDQVVYTQTHHYSTHTYLIPIQYSYSDMHRYSKEFFDFHTQSYSNRNIRLEYAQTDRMIQNVQKMSDLKGFFFYINHKKT